ncbi:hypothetical protein [Pseudomonas lopnurensis]|uniref:hypothetical protein n=1 Tax=Pseudomonas lopnurensis TaxID=1477517 RepID=UPI0028A9EE87|nr:hypothetical protein [Pseudomonas lopnurensis]
MRLSVGARYASGPCLPSWGLVAHGETDQGSSRTAERGNGEEYVFAALVDGENLSSALLGSILLGGRKGRYRRDPQGLWRLDEAGHGLLDATPAGKINLFPFLGPLFSPSGGMAMSE